MDKDRSDPPNAAPSTFGTSRVVLCRDGLVVSTVTLSAGLKFGPHAHDHDQLCVVLEGHYQESCDANVLPLCAGNVLWRPAGGIHSNVVGAEDVSVILVDIEQPRSQKLGLGSAGGAECFVLGSLEEISRDLSCEVHRSDQASRVAIEGLVCLLAAHIGRLCALPRVAMPEWLWKARELIRSRYAHRITLSQVAAASGVHPATVALAFRRHLGKSVGEYVTDLRVAHARDEIESTRRPVAEIAQESGFYDESHMGRVFRRRFGVSPGTLRRRSI